MSQQFLVLGVRGYNFTTDAGQALQGMKVIYLDQPEDSPMLKGYLPLQAPADFSILGAFEAKPWPGIYELDFRQRPDSRTGKPILTCTGARFVKPADIEIPS